jgi:hypothetical protein
MAEKAAKTLQDLTPKKRRKKAWETVFLDALAESGNVSKAAAVAHITRPTAYALRNSPDAPDFTEAWEDALEEAGDLMELEARRRAVDGTQKPVFYQGDIVGHIREYSDTLLIFLLKAAKPEKYRERTSTDNYNIDLTALSDEQLKRLERGENIYSVLRAS